MSLLSSYKYCNNFKKIFLGLFFIFNYSYAQGLPNLGTSNLLLIYCDVKDSTTFSFQPIELSNKVDDFFYKMSFGKLKFDITSLRIDIDNPDQFNNYQEALVYLLEETEQRISLEDFSVYDDTSVLDGICIIFDNFYHEWKDNPQWSGLASILLLDQNQKFDGKIIKRISNKNKSSGIVMRAPNNLEYSFWVLAHEITHLFGLDHFPESVQYPFYQLMNTSGDYWGTNRGMAFWEKEKLNWIEPNIKLKLTHTLNETDTISFSLEDYMTTGSYAKVFIPETEKVENDTIVKSLEDAFYFEHRKKISPYDQETNRGDEGIFIWRRPGKLVHADKKADYSIFPTNDAFGMPNGYSFNHELYVFYEKIEELVPEEGFYKQQYKLPVKVIISKDNKITLEYGPAIRKKRQYVSTDRESGSSVRLSENYPNPFNPSTTISFNLSRTTKVKLDVYDVVGRKIKTLYNGFLEAGNHRFLFDATGLSSGTYFYRIIAPARSISNSAPQIHTGKMLYVK